MARDQDKAIDEKKKVKNVNYNLDLRNLSLFRHFLCTFKIPSKIGLRVSFTFVHERCVI